MLIHPDTLLKYENALDWLNVCSSFELYWKSQRLRIRMHPPSLQIHKHWLVYETCRPTPRHVPCSSNSATTHLAASSTTCCEVLDFSSRLAIDSNCVNAWDSDSKQNQWLVEGARVKNWVTKQHENSLRKQLKIFSRANTEDRQSSLLRSRPMALPDPLSTGTYECRLQASNSRTQWLFQAFEAEDIASISSKLPKL